MHVGAARVTDTTVGKPTVFAFRDHFPTTKIFDTTPQNPVKHRGRRSNPLGRPGVGGRGRSRSLPRRGENPAGCHGQPWPDLRGGGRERNRRVMRVGVVVVVDVVG